MGLFTVINVADEINMPKFPDSMNSSPSVSSKK
jgi:hypothetical protein